MTSGIYIIRQTTTGRVYVGSAVNLAARKRDHFRNLRAGTHANGFMQAAFTKAPASFEFIVALECAKGDLLAMEQAFLDALYDGHRRCFNICSVAGSVLGYRHTKQARHAIACRHRVRLGHGVSRHGQRWRARAMVGGVQRHLGVFDTKAEAAKAVAIFQDTAKDTRHRRES